MHHSLLCRGQVCPRTITVSYHEHLGYICQPSNYQCYDLETAGGVCECSLAHVAAVQVEIQIVSCSSLRIPSKRLFPCGPPEGTHKQRVAGCALTSLQDECRVLLKEASLMVTENGYPVRT